MLSIVWPLISSDMTCCVSGYTEKTVYHIKKIATKMKRMLLPVFLPPKKPHRILAASVSWTVYKKTYTFIRFGYISGYDCIEWIINVRQPAHYILQSYLS